MKAVLSKAPGGPETLVVEERPDPVAGEGEVVIAIKAFGVNIPSFLLHNPLLEVVQVGATVRRVKDAKLHKKDSEPQGTGSGIMAGLLGLTEEIPFMKEAVEYTKVLDPMQRSTAMAELAKSFFVPAAVDFAAQKTDKDSRGQPVKRKAKGAVEGIKSGIPGLRQTLPRRDMSTDLRTYQ